ncbi:hypothetical protein BDW75DRAFT_245361 [Aspergillus navahoensis]
MLLGHRDVVKPAFCRRILSDAIPRDEDLALELIEYGAPLHEGWSESAPSLTIAALYGRTRALFESISKGAKLEETPNYGHIALTIAVSRNHAEAVRRLLAAGAFTSNPVHFESYADTADSQFMSEREKRDGISFLQSAVVMQKS